MSLLLTVKGDHGLWWYPWSLGSSSLDLSKPPHGQTDIKLTLTSSSKIRRIEADYINDESERRRTSLVDTSHAVDLKAMEADTTLPTSTGEPICTPSSSTPATSGTAVISRSPLTHAMLYKKGHFSHSGDVRASRVEAVVPSMIERAIEAALAPIREEL
uniref:Integrase core domain containing protein n=1 Tax=Solanum tuberosum TaxID=4113 RepID=M1D8Y0_SOLTU